MKRVTASDARKNWFRLLDEVAAGTVVRIERRGTTILLQRAAELRADAAFDYSLRERHALVVRELRKPA